MSSDDDTPLGRRAGPSAVRHVNGANGNSKKVSRIDSSDEDEEMPMVKEELIRESGANKQQPARHKRKKAAYAESSSAFSEDEPDIPLSQSTAIPMPGAVAATTVPTTKAKAESDDDDAPVGKASGKASSKAARKPPKKKVKVEAESDEDFEEEKEEKPVKAKKASATKKRKVKDESDADSDEDENPAKKKKTPAKKKVKKEEDSDGEEKPAKKKAPAKKRVKKEEVDDSDEPKPKKRAPKGKKEEGDDDEGSPKKGKAKKVKKEKEPEEPVFRWWEATGDGDTSDKWQTLVHSGVLFPPPYEILPSHVKMKYNNVVVDLPPESEEVAGFYAALLESPHAQDAVFRKNFMTDWLVVLARQPPRNGVKIKDFELCDFRPMYEYFEDVKAQKKAVTAAEKKEAKAQKEALELRYSTCMLDGRKEKVGNYRVEPPGLFKGRGEHPKKGCLKSRLGPGDISLNIGENAPIPVPNIPGEWREIVHKKEATWLAMWTENINKNHKYVFLAAGSSLKGQSDMMKFEKARELKKYVDAIRKDYLADLKSKVMADRQRATAMYFIDRLALRAGNEKGEDEADTVGCCSLRCEHVTLEAPNFIIFDFLGKDSIRYYNRVAVEPQVFKNIRIFKENKDDDDDLFDRVNTALMNKHLSTCMKGLTAKVFRTYNASLTLQTQLDSKDLSKATMQEKLNTYNEANRMVAILCNHQKAAPKTHEQSMDKMRHKLKGFQYDRMKLRHALFEIDSDYKKDKRFKEMEPDIDEEFVVEWEDEQRALNIEKARKKFEKDNEKLKEDGKEEQDQEVLDTKIEEIDAEYDRLKDEQGTNLATLKNKKTDDLKIIEMIEKIDQKIKTFGLQMHDKDAGKEVALGTSKINYLDPRITAAWCKKNDVPIEKIFSKTLMVKFPWAMEVEDDWKF